MQENTYEDEISLKELILILLNQWKMIVAVTIIGTVIVGIVSFFILTPVYETKVKLIMDIPESVVTEVGTYHYPSTVTSDYSGMLTNGEVIYKTINDFELSVSRELFAKRIGINQEKESKVVTVSYKGENPEQISEILNQHITNYYEFLNRKIKTDAINKFIENYQIKLETNERSYKQVKLKLAESEKLLSEMSPVISLKKALTASPEIAAQFARNRGINVADLSENMLYEEIINTNYTNIDKMITDYKVSVSNLEIDKIRLDEMIQDLEEERKLMEASVDGGSGSDYLSVVSSFVQQISSADIPLNPIAPKKSLNVAIGFVLSAMVAVFVAFFRAYWNNEEKQDVKIVDEV